MKKTTMMKMKSASLLLNNNFVLMNPTTLLVKSLHSLNAKQFTLFKNYVFCCPQLLNSFYSQPNTFTFTTQQQRAAYSTSNNKSSENNYDNNQSTHKRLSEMVTQFMRDPNIKPKVSEDKIEGVNEEEEEVSLSKLTWRERKIHKTKTQWKPMKKLPRAEMEKLRFLHEQDPDLYTRPFLAQKFGISPEAVRRILSSRWRPTEKEQEKQERRKIEVKAEDNEKRESVTKVKTRKPQPYKIVRKVRKSIGNRVLSKYKEKYIPKVNYDNNMSSFNNDNNHNSNSNSINSDQSSKTRNAENPPKTKATTKGMFSNQNNKKPPKKLSLEQKTGQ